VRKSFKVTEKEKIKRGDYLTAKQQVFSNLKHAYNILKPCVPKISDPDMHMSIYKTLWHIEAAISWEDLISNNDVSNEQ